MVDDDKNNWTAGDIDPVTVNIANRLLFRPPET